MDRSFAEKLTKGHEGTRTRVYLDTKGIPTIGNGLNLLAAGVPQLFQSLGLDYGQVLHGMVDLTQEQVETLFQHSFDSAVKWAKADVPNFDELRDNTQAVLVDMAFNMGQGRLAKFTKMIAHLQEKNYAGAAAEMKNSAWYIENHHRAIEDMDLVLQDAAAAKKEAQAVGSEPSAQPA